MLKRFTQRCKERRSWWIIRRSRLFDREYYLRNNLDVARSGMDPILHYIRHGWLEGRDPSREFQTKWYLETYHDVAQAGMNPLYHYLTHGIKENRRLCSMQSPPTRMTSPDPHQYYYECNEVKYTENKNEYLSRISSFKYKPLFSVLLPVYKSNIAFLKEAIESVLSQIYGYWELCIVDDCSEDPEIINVIESYAAEDARIKWIRRDSNGHISVASNDCIAISSGDYIVILDHDDILSKGALYEFAVQIQNTDADFIYADEDKVDQEGNHLMPFFKPDWSPDLLRACNYICHPVAIRKEYILQIGGFREGFEGSQDHDLFLRLSEITTRIEHIPKILYSWRMHSNSTSFNPDSKRYAHESGRKAVYEHAKRVYGDSVSMDDNVGMFRHNVRFSLPRGTKVSIIIPTKDRLELLRPCIETILNNTTYRDYEVLILDNQSTRKDTLEWYDHITQMHSQIRVIPANYDFNWSKINNHGARESRGEVLVFLNNDTMLITQDWLERLSEQSLRHDVGAVGPMLLFRDDTIQHAGVVVGMGGWADHVWCGAVPDMPTNYYIAPDIKRNVLAVTGACMAVSKKTFDILNGFNETFIVCGSDVDFCLRAFEGGLWNIYDPMVRLYHYESATRDPSAIPDQDFIASRKAYQRYLQKGDPFYNENLDLSQKIPSLKKLQESSLSKNMFNIESLPTNISYSLEETALFNNRIVIQETLLPEVCHSVYSDIQRINLLIPGIDPDVIYGGIATALQLLQSFMKYAGSQVKFRIISTDRQVDKQNVTHFKKQFPPFSEFEYIRPNQDGGGCFDITSIADRLNTRVSIAAGDIFIATGWWTAYVANYIIKKQSELFQQKPHPLVYLIQDYEPGFYPWSSRYALAESTYKFSEPVIAIFNTRLLRDYFIGNGYTFESHYFFEPVINPAVLEHLNHSSCFRKQRIILFYGRPETPRNCIELLAETAREWALKTEHPNRWTLLSAGEPHPDIGLAKGIKIRSLGKLALDQYADLLKHTFAGVSLMVSPHPSYPPLEMAHFGVKVITNSYANKNLSSFHPNIISVDNVTPSVVARELLALTDSFGFNDEVTIPIPDAVLNYLSKQIDDGFVFNILDTLKLSKIS